MKDKLKKFISIPEAASYAMVSEDKIKELIKEGLITSGLAGTIETQTLYMCLTDMNSSTRQSLARIAAKDLARENRDVRVVEIDAEIIVLRQKAGMAETDVINRYSPEVQLNRRRQMQAQR